MITAVILAAGSGARTGFSENKVLKELNGLPVLCRSLSAFSQVEEVGELIIACRAEDEARVEQLLSPYPHARTVRGGKTRAESVYFALREAKGDIVLVHDGARPFVTERVIRGCIASVKERGSGICALPVTDTVALAKGGTFTGTTAREETFSVQTPQGFERIKLLVAYERAKLENAFARYTDDGGLYAHYYEPPCLCAGAPENRKLTYAADFAPAERVGFGVDTHAFCPPAAQSDSHITLGGIRIPSDRALKAHSDGDVLVHALMDALLSAAGLRDIGYYFPDTDKRYRGADSMRLLAEVVRLVHGAGFAPQNASVSVLAEAPRLFPHIEGMKENLSRALGLPASAIGIAAGTNEKLGYVGEGKGITAYATVLLKNNP